MIVRGRGRLNCDRHFYSPLTEHQFMLTKGRPIHGLLMHWGDSWNKKGTDPSFKWGTKAASAGTDAVVVGWCMLISMWC